MKNPHHKTDNNAVTMVIKVTARCSACKQTGAFYVSENVKSKFHGAGCKYCGHTEYEIIRRN